MEIIKIKIKKDIMIKEKILNQSLRDKKHIRLILPTPKPKSAPRELANIKTIIARMEKREKSILFFNEKIKLRLKRKGIKVARCEPNRLP